MIINPLANMVSNVYLAGAVKELSAVISPSSAVSNDKIVELASLILANLIVDPSSRDEARGCDVLNSAVVQLKSENADVRKSATWLLTVWSREGTFISFTTNTI